MLLNPQSYAISETDCVVSISIRVACPSRISSRLFTNEMPVLALKNRLKDYVMNTAPDGDISAYSLSALCTIIDKIVNDLTHHLDLFFEDDWSVKGHEISFGHDIEASWLLQEAAEVIDDADLIRRTRILAVLIARAAARGLDSDGGLLYESDANYRKWIHEKHWWPQAEGMVGFLNAFQLTGDRVFLQQSLGCWNFVKARLKSPTGEWYWGIATDGTLMEKDKVGPWKCPYHNSRACMEVIRRIDELMEHEKISRTETDKP